MEQPPTDKTEHAHIQFRLGPQLTAAVDELVRDAAKHGERVSRGNVCKMLVSAALSATHTKAVAAEMLRFATQLQADVTNAASSAAAEALVERIGQGTAK